MEKGHVMYIEAVITLERYEDEFESYEEYEEDFNKMLADLKYKKALFVDFLLNHRDEIIEELVFLVNNNKCPILVKLLTKGAGKTIWDV